MRRRNIQDGICPRALKVLGPHTNDRKTYSMLRSVTSRRQREIADLMQKSADYTFCFMQLLIAATKRCDFSGGKTRTRGVTRNELAAIERTFGGLENAFRKSAPSYQEDTLTFLVSLAYVRKLLLNSRITKYLKTFHPRHYRELALLAPTTRAGSSPAAETRSGSERSLESGP
jgi:hypothetical protein